MLKQWACGYCGNRNLKLRPTQGDRVAGSRLRGAFLLMTSFVSIAPYV
jgi:hypothetical protein